MKIERDEIDRLLALAEDRPESSYPLHGLEVIAVCRAWLAMAAAPECEITRKDWLENAEQFSAGLIGKRVRLVITDGL